MKEWRGEKNRPFIVNDQFGGARPLRIDVCPGETPHGASCGSKHLSVGIQQDSQPIGRISADATSEAELLGCGHVTSSPLNLSSEPSAGTDPSVFVCFVFSLNSMFSVDFKVL